MGPKSVGYTPDHLQPAPLMSTMSSQTYRGISSSSLLDGRNLVTCAAGMAPSSIGDSPPYARFMVCNGTVVPFRAGLAKSDGGGWLILPLRRLPSGIFVRRYWLWIPRLNIRSGRRGPRPGFANTVATPTTSHCWPWMGPKNSSCDSHGWTGGMPLAPVARPPPASRVLNRIEAAQDVIYG